LAQYYQNNKTERNTRHNSLSKKIRLEGDMNHLMPELIPEPDSTDGENKKKKIRNVKKKKKNCSLKYIFLIK
jgi:hypothetical protein